MLGVDNATSEVVHHFLRSLTVKVSRTTVCRLLDSPLGNTMQGISDALNALHVNNVVYQLQPKYLEKLAHPTNPVEGCADANPKTVLPNDT